MDNVNEILEDRQKKAAIGMIVAVCLLLLTGFMVKSIQTPEAYVAGIAFNILLMSGTYFYFKYALT